MEMQSGIELQRRIDRTHESPLFYKIFALVAGGMFLDAADVYMASAVASTVLKTGWSTLAQNSYFLSSGFLGLFIGSLTAGFIGDLKGRRVAYQINLLLFGGFTFLAAFAPNMWMLIICRLFSSIGLGSEIVTGYSMVNEFAPIHSRGKWCAAVSLIANSGAPITMLLCTLIIPHYGWRVMFAGIGIVAAILWYLRRDIPESPRWLMAHGRKPKQSRSLNNSKLMVAMILPIPRQRSGRRFITQSESVCLWPLWRFRQLLFVSIPSHHGSQPCC
jgi:Arabinose efflux permease